MQTFCDFEDDFPPVKIILESNCSPFSAVIPSIKDPWYLKFNNGHVYKNIDDNIIKKVIWELNMKSF